jgi:hypothetical protein
MLGNPLWGDTSDVLPLDVGVRTSQARQRSVVSSANGTCPSRKSYSHVPMMQSGQDLSANDGPKSLDGASSRHVLAQPQGGGVRVTQPNDDI